MLMTIEREIEKKCVAGNLSQPRKKLKTKEDWENIKTMKTIEIQTS